MLAIPHLSQVFSMAEIDSKEAQKQLKAGICLRIPSHNKHTSFLLYKRSTSCKSPTPSSAPVVSKLPAAGLSPLPPDRLPPRKRTGLAELRHQLRDTAEQLQLCQIAQISDKERIKRLEAYLRI
ncbi:hypothetical protein Tco_0508817 [Tanacetum coccineum]